ncbi:MAG: serine/threonine protein kinase [Polyangiaceae bacterium]|nr:serine/threonine protein kinase [Polyangiaceae bacterium]
MIDKSPYLASLRRVLIPSFADLTPDRILVAAEAAGGRATGRTWGLRALENRVYEVELEDNSRVIVKFYRPGRHSTEAIVDEHRLLAALAEDEIPVVAPLRLASGHTLATEPDGHRYAVFPKAPGRAPDELTLDEYERIGKLTARLHNVSASLDLPARPILSPATYGTACIERTLALGSMPLGTRSRYQDAARRLVVASEALFAELAATTFVVHADCHRGNVLSAGGKFFFLDFDDAARAPAVQDLWLLLPGRPRDCSAEIDAWVEGYEVFRTFDERSLNLIEALRGLRYLRYAAWIADRSGDPAFRQAFPQFGTGGYWEGLVGDLHEQLVELGVA